MPSAKAPSSSAGAIGDRLQGAEHVGEPQPDEADVALFDGAQDELLLTVHVSILPHRCFLRVTATRELRTRARRMPGARAEGPRDASRGPSGRDRRQVEVSWKRTFTCSSLPPSVVLATVIEVPEPATLVDAHGLSAVQ